jgi:hypothetical protein
MPTPTNSDNIVSATSQSAIRLREAQSVVEFYGTPFSDSAGVSASYLPLNLVPAGVEIVEAWEPYLVVERVEQKGYRARMHFVGGHVGGWCSPTDLVPVRVPTTPQ